MRLAQVKKQWSYFLAVSMILAFSVFYELMEAVVAMLVSPELGNAYLGTQGDEWDAEKDSFLAFSGAIIAMLLTWIYLRKNSHKKLDK
jgi:putative membrane protein